ncbi:oligosaccharide flippase family protein [Niveibacterium sp.]|uniref:oligosaccharide flippase family protein n=1 Tax=Niveibacterium sp. TaxID=2017444 RepID=UPI0035B379FB
MFWNVLGMGLPMLIALMVVPVLLSRIGDARFGLVSIAWVLVGYLGVLDLGLGRALTREVAEIRGRGGNAAEQDGLARRATDVMVLIGVGWAVVLAGLASRLGGHWLSVPDALQQEARNAFFCVAFGAPALLYTNAKLAWLEGQERYGVSNAIRTPLAALTMLAPMLMSLLTPRLDFVLGAMLAVRLFAASGIALVLPFRRTPGDMSPVAMQGLWRFSGWLTVTNVIGPILVYCDRLYIGAVLSAAAVTYYTVPYDVVVRLTSLPFAALAVLFPRMTVLLREDVASLRTVLARAGALMIWGWAPMLLAVSLVAREILSLWVGPAFLGDSLVVWHWLAIGVFLNGMAFIPYNLIQSAGRSDITAKFHLLEVPVFALALVVLTRQIGIVGAACAWTLRVALDAALLYAAAWRMHPALRLELRRSAIASLAWSAAMCAAVFSTPPVLRWGAAALACALGAYVLLVRRRALAIVEH